MTSSPPRRLWVLRHAKSVRDDPSLPDHDRPLAPRGEHAAERIARWAREAGVRPELILCSTALRARQTLERVRPGLGEDAEVEFDPSLYAFDADALLARVRELPEAVRSVMLVGHNPAMQELVLTVASSGEGLDDVRRKFPTGAVARLDLGVGSWRELDASTARLGVFVTPRGLA